jgi:hypothetical protein
VWSVMKRYPWLTGTALAVLWYYSWSLYVEAVPHTSMYFDRTQNPIPDAFGEMALPTPDGHFAEAALLAVASPFDEVRALMKGAVSSRFGVSYSGPERFGPPPGGESLSAEIVGLPYSRTPDLGRWKAKDGSSFLMVSLVSARSLGQPLVTVVEIHRVDHWRSWARREFHTGLQFPFPIRLDNSRAVVTGTELEFIAATLGSTYAGPTFVYPGWEAWREETRIKALVERATRAKQ